jgi:hypothetical protein
MPCCIQVSKDAQHAAQLTVQTRIHCAAILLHMRTSAESSDHVLQLIDVLQSVCLSWGSVLVFTIATASWTKKCILRLLLMFCMAVSNISTFLA